MFGKLKEMAGSAASDKVIEKLIPFVNEHLSACLRLGAPALKQDDTFTQQVIHPAYLATTAAVSGATSLIPQFKERFTKAFFLLRDELLEFSEEGVTLVPDFKARLPVTLKQALAPN